MSIIATNTRGASILLEHAFTEGLPQPAFVNVHAYPAALEQPQATFGFDNVDHVQAWADYMGVEVSGKVSVYGHTIEAKGSPLDFTVKCWFFEAKWPALAGDEVTEVAS